VTIHSNPTRVVATLPQLQQHALDLAAAFDVRVVESSQIKPHEAFAAPHLRLVVVSPIVDDTTYAVVLHEVGHLCAPLGVLRTSSTSDALSLKQAEEDAAWTWARHYALDWTPAMDAVAAWAEGTYQPPPPPRRPEPNSQIDWSRYDRR
jgi:hypothetical protein